MQTSARYHNTDSPTEYELVKPLTKSPKPMTQRQIAELHAALLAAYLAKQTPALALPKVRPSH